MQSACFGGEEKEEERERQGGGAVDLRNKLALFFSTLCGAFLSIFPPSPHTLTLAEEVVTAAVGVCLHFGRCELTDKREREKRIVPLMRRRERGI